MGPYEIVAPLGQGGMGEVYRALDTRLDRTVVIKMLSSDIADSPARRQRFEREARTLSSLNHPHICSLYDVGETPRPEPGGPSPATIHFLVMEYVEGETLASRLIRGALPIDQVLRHAIEIADALDHAHRQGIVHRDLKPANIMLTRAGVKLLDFGIAKLCTSDTMTGRSLAATRLNETITEEGTIVGTLRYMAPEQLEARDTDRRADIFAFGAILYEMATGRQAFEGASQASVIVAILERSPAPLKAARAETPPLLDRIVTRCLAKHPDDRWQTASDLGQALQWIADGASPSAVGTTAPPMSRLHAQRAGWIAAGIFLAIAILATTAVLIISSRRAVTDQHAVQFTVPPPENASFNRSSAFMAVSPDGRALAFVASSRDGNSTLWVRPLDSLVARQLPGTEGAFQPFWSPDSKFIAFGTTGKLKKIDVSGGLPQALAANPSAGGGAWNSDGIIIFHASAAEGGPLYRVSASGGPVTRVTTLDASRGETAAWPQFLPDGRHFIYLARDKPEDDGVVYVGALDSTDRIRLLTADSQATYTYPGFLLFMRASTLFAQPFDPSSARLTGEPVPIADQIERTPGSHRGAFSASQTQTPVVAYRRIGDTQLTWFDRGGRPLDSVGPLGHYRNPALSPDEQRIAVERLDPETGTSDIWQMELTRHGASRFGPASAVMPLWSPDGSRIVFKSSKNLYQQASNGNGAAELLLANLGAFGSPLDWTRDGKMLIFHQNDRLWMLPLTGDRRPVAWLKTQDINGQGQLSPDGRWMAYVSDESRKNEVYIRSFPSGEGKRQISADGGIEPTWRRDEKELLYLAPDGNLMAVAVTTPMAGSTFEASAPVPLFKTRMSTLVNAGYVRNQYVVVRDGQRILVNQPPAGAPSSPIDVVLNWTATLKK